MENALVEEIARNGREWQLFIKKQEEIINQRLTRYLNPKTVREDSLELKGEITPYQRYKSTSVAPQLINALEMIRTGKYGICKDCEQEIPIGRLRLVPGANRCLPCQTAHDKK
jgi:RNA polymerase-binding transcription factor DksA